MTALNPNKAVRVEAAQSERYPLNPISAKPDSLEPATDPHHIWPRSKIKSDSWFVAVSEADEDKVVIPHVTGLAHSEHMDVEDHRSKILYEYNEDAVIWEFVWYDRVETSEEEKDRWEKETGSHRDDYPVDTWVRLGPLNPQPGAVGTPKKKRRTFKGEEKRNRVNWQVKVPKDSLEDGAGILDDLIEQLRNDHEILELYPDGGEPAYFILVAALNLALQR